MSEATPPASEEWRQLLAHYENVVKLYAAIGERYEAQAREDQAFRRDMNHLKSDAIKKGMQLLSSLLPEILKKAGSKFPDIDIYGPTTSTFESIALANFLNGLSKEQAIALFGSHVEGSTECQGGVFSAPQTKVIAGVAHGELPATELDRLLRGEHRFTSEQLQAAQEVLREDQWLPLMAFFMEMEKAKSGAA